MLQKSHRPYYWMNNVEKIYEVAKTCNYRTEFRKKFKGASYAASKLGIFEDVCSHMVKKGRGSKRCIYLIEFPNKVCYVGLTNDFSQREKQHRNSKTSSVSKHKETTGHDFTMRMIENYMDEKESQLKEEFYKNKYEKLGYKILNIFPTGGLGGSYILHTINTCRKDASKYKSKIEYREKNRSSYESARANGWLNEICQHMTSLHNNWNLDEILELSSSYESTWDFGKNNRAAYEWIRRNGHLNELINKIGKKKKSLDIYTKEYCENISKNFKSKMELCRNNQMVYKISLQNNWLNDFYKK